MAYRLILTDVDGTLIHSDLTIGERTKEALRRADRMGIRTVISTGRFLRGVEFLGRELGFDPIFSCVNGALIKDGEKYLSLIPIDRETYEKAARIAHGRTRCLMAFGEESYGIFADDYFFDFQTRLFKFSGIPMDLRDYDAVTEALGSPILKLLVKDTDPEPIDKVLQDFIDSGLGSTANLVKSGNGIIEVIRKGVGKGLSVDILSKYFNIDKSEIIAFGDYDNDIEMLREAGLGVGMANGSRARLAAADYITTSNDEDGIADALEKLVFSKQC